jgi:hypothetical protein
MATFKGNQIKQCHVDLPSYDLRPLAPELGARAQKTACEFVYWYDLAGYGEVSEPEFKSTFGYYNDSLASNYCLRGVLWFARQLFYKNCLQSIDEVLFTGIRTSHLH